MQSTQCAWHIRCAASCGTGWAVHRSAGESAGKRSRRFHQETGRTIHQYVEDMVFQAACKRLAVGSQPIGEISGGLGFCDP